MTAEQIKELYQLLNALREDVITDAQFERLDSCISTNEYACRLYVDYVKLWAELENFQSAARPGYDPTTMPFLQLKEKDFTESQLWQALLEHERTAPATIIPKVEPPRELIQKVVYPKTPPRQVNKFSVYTLIISAAAILFAILYVRFAPLPATTVATITDSIDAQWAQSEHSTDIGSELWNNEGTRWLHKGIVKIEFDYGAEVIIEGPSAFEMKDEEKMVLHSGRLYATVPKEATGFTVQTPYSTIIDLGTEFAVKVGHNGTTDVHVLKGKASLIPGASRRKGESRELLAGQANRVDTSGQVKEIPLQDKSFVRPGQFEIMSKADKGSAYHRWLLHSNELRKDPSLVAYYIFAKDKATPNKVRNFASVTRDALDGTLARGEGGQLPLWTTGRWPKKTALDFYSAESSFVEFASDRRVEITGPITIWAWVKLPAGREGGPIVANRVPGGHCNYKFNITRELMDFLRISITGNYSDRAKIVYGRQLDEEWHFVAMTHDNKTVSFYLDGVQIGSQQHEYYPKSQSAKMLIGSNGFKKGVMSHFDGLIGELGIFDRALSVEQIDEIFQNGRTD